jgi:5-methylcytosine-specific restriction protein B
LNDNIYNLFVYFDSDFLNRFNLQINFFNFPSSLNFIELPVAFHQKASESGLLFNIDLVKRFIASLCTKPFLICSGLSGSGKTKLAQAFAQWISFDTSQYLIVPVGADWTNREPLLGYSNALVSDEYVYPENGALNLILTAKENYDQHLADSKTVLKPYFLILDEMNLSHVERYFADFLSSMESGDSIPLHKITNEKKGIPGNVNLPKNLFIIGTVNIDETTYMFSPKVLDRANTIEFRITETELNQYIDNEVKLDLNVLKNQGSNLSGLFMSFAILETERNLKKSKNDLNLFFNELKKFGSEFGFRTASEIGRLMKMLELLGNDKDSLLDIAIMQKLLPKLHGSRSKLNATLVTLAKFCVQDALKDFEGKDDEFKKYFFKPIESLLPDQLTRITYKVSFEKIVRMHKNALENGFTSYAEA